MADKGMLDTGSIKTVTPGVRYDVNKIARAQLGVGLHMDWINDIIRHCGATALYICDFAHGVGEVITAGINCKVGEAATSTGVRVCLWSQDPRKIFAEIGSAIGRTELSKLYVSGKLNVGGHQPVPDPGSRPERSRKLVKAMLREPLKHLSLNSEGFLVIPSQEELSKLCPVKLDDEQKEEFENLRAKFPRLTAVDTTVDGSTEAGGSAAGNSPDSEGAGKASPPTLPPGTQVESEEDLKENLETKFYLRNLCPKVTLLLPVRSFCA